MRSFRRGLAPTALNALSAMVESSDPNWWKDLLALWSPSGTSKGARQLRLAIRDNYLNFYLRGQSVARVGFDSRSKPYVEVHVKYAFSDATEQAYAKLIGSEVLHPKGGHSGIYVGPATLREWMSRAATWETAEKAQVERIVADNAAVIDLEMGLPAHEGQKTALRMDIVAIEAVGQGTQIVFWEAKQISDSRLRSMAPMPEVTVQVDAYRRYLADANHRAAVENAYRETCRTLCIFAEMASADDPKQVVLDPLIRNAGAERSALTIDDEPRLVIFGSTLQYADPVWMRHEDKLRNLGVRMLKLRTDGYALTVPLSRPGLPA